MQPSHGSSKRSLIALTKLHLVRWRESAPLLTCSHLFSSATVSYKAVGGNRYAAANGAEMGGDCRETSAVKHDVSNRVYSHYIFNSCI
jgi:hypothetical protein